jgi:hypothetical protein
MEHNSSDQSQKAAITVDHRPRAHRPLRRVGDLPSNGWGNQTTGAAELGLPSHVPAHGPAYSGLTTAKMFTTPERSKAAGDQQ